jgi:flagellar transcriptional activator FlhD
VICGLGCFAETQALRALKAHMNTTGNVNEIGDLNLAYLLLAQRLVREDIASAMFRLGMNRELADLMGNLSLSQIVKLSNSSMLLCRFRFDDHPILATLTNDHKNQALQQAHTAILLSSQEVEMA